MNKVTVPLKEATRLINHGPCILVSVGDSTRDNLFTVAWNMPVKKEPALVAIESSKAHYSYPFIERLQEFCINVPTADIAESVLKAGTISGAKVDDKFSYAGLTREKPARISAPRVAEAVAHLECRVHQIVDMETSALIIGEVQCAAADETVFFNGVWHFETGLQLLHHIGANQFCTSERKILL